jgi:protein phosphatase
MVRCCHAHDGASRAARLDPGIGGCIAGEGHVKVSFHGHTDVGRRRPLNEDTIYAQDSLFLVCDGMGGHKAGEVASKLAAETVAAFVRHSTEDPEMTWPFGYDTRLSHDANRLSTAIKLANRVVLRHAASGDEYTGMGTTIAAVLVHSRRPHMTYANVGDSRIYLLRSGAMQQLTRDDTWANLDWGGNQDPHETSAMTSVLTKALGAQDDVQFDVVSQELQDEDLVLLCSDGLTHMLPDQRIFEIASTRAEDLPRACEELVSSANAEGGRDNISVILVRLAS